jgi:drug/metabolite transporter (DMT)-like permease
LSKPKAPASAVTLLKRAAASVVVPFQYTLIIWAVLLGYVVFDDVPDAATLAGAVVVVVTGALHPLARADGNAPEG